MARIVVNPGELRNLGGYLRSNVSLLEVGAAGLHSAVYRLDWELRAGYPVEVEWRRARRKVEAALHQGFRLASFLESKAALFERADRSGYSVLQDFNRVLRRIYFTPTASIEGLLRLLGVKSTIEDKRFQRVFHPCTIPFLPGIAGPFSLGVLGLYNSLIKDKETRSGVMSLAFEALEKLVPDAGGLVLAKFLSKTFLEYSETKELSGRDLRVAAGKSAVELLISVTPHGKAVLLGSAAVQVGGNLLIRGVEAQGKAYCVETFHDQMIEQSADRAHRALAKLDVGNITRDLGAITNDVLLEPQIAAWQEAWREPNAGNTAKAFFTSLNIFSNPVSGIGYALSNPHTRSMLFQDIKSLGFHVMDFSVGVFEAPAQYLRHGLVTQWAITSENIAGSIPSSLREKFVSQSDSLLRSINSGWEFPTMEQAFRDYERAIGASP